MLRNSILRNIGRLWPINKGRYRYMKLWEKFLLPCEEEISNFHGKFSFKLDLSKRGLQTSLFYFIPEYYETGTQRYLRETIKPCAVTMDIGAHIGFHTLLLAALAEKKGKVYSFEPLDDNFAVLTKNLAINSIKNVIVFFTALSNKPEAKIKLFGADIPGQYSIIDTENHDFKEVNNNIVSRITVVEL